MWPTIGYQSPPSLPERQMPERPATSTAGSAHGCVASIASAIWAGVELFPPSMKPGRVDSHHGAPPGPPTLGWTLVASPVTECQLAPPSPERTIASGDDWSAPA